MKEKFCLKLTLAKKGDIRETLAFEKIGEGGGQVTAETVPLETKLLLIRVHNVTLLPDPVTFATPLALAL